MKINWKQKLSSRKFWALLAALSVAIIGGAVSPEVAAQVSGIIGAVGACIVYMLAESSVDKATALNSIYKEADNDSENL